ncbi:ABC-three component system protein [Micromonospora sp. URMC 105]|uniref:ABC-three component system protein n=1 Tax=Micromonospora sp. URMC 105 TaxID=3423413 RepID=UPI003F5298D6
MTLLNDQDRAWFQSHFMALCVRKTGFDWQSFVTDLMYAKHGGQFLQVNPSGRGDKGCDGWIDGLMLACYGASNPNQAYVTKKIKDDFTTALTHWGSDMERWAFVHNDAVGLPTMAVMGIVELRREVKGKTEVQIEAWPPQVLWDYCCSDLPRSKLASILGAPPSDHPAGMSYIARCVETLARTRLPADLEEVSEVPYGKIEHNEFGEEVAELIKKFQTQTSHVRYYFSQSTPGEQSQASQMLRVRFDKYRALLGNSDAVFHALCDSLVQEAFANSEGYGDAEQQRSAAMMVVTHFFEICEIFESPEEVGYAPTV